VKVLYFDAFSGAAGDMILGALVDAGLPFDALKSALGTLGVEGWDVSVERVVKGGITASKFRVHEHAHALAAGTAAVRAGHRHYHLNGIKNRIDQSSLGDAAKERAKGLFDRLAAVEASVHDMPVERVHLHEVGALDSIVDIVGCVFALDWFEADRIVVSPLNVGSGTVKTAHGLYPVPAPATLRLLGEAPVYGREQSGELLTPTGALILTAYADAYGPMPPMRVDQVGYGAGDRDLEGTPNVLRVVVGRAAADVRGMTVACVECEIDDMNPQLFGPLMDRLYAAGALEVFYTAVQMKKNRPGTLMTIICSPDARGALTDIVFRETTTIGVRFTEMVRDCLEREIVPVQTPLGAVRFKVARRHGQVMNAQPEFDDLTRVAAEHTRPIKDVQALAWKAWLER
jgi:pyridinium-3,5-bisthiocarboxylic acid mononucleotide nickel chelatase